MYFVECDSAIEPWNPGGILTYAFIVKEKGKGEVYRGCGISGEGPSTTNNQGEYHAVMAALLWLLKLPTEKRRPVIIRSDSQLIVNQCEGDWNVGSPELKKLHEMVRKAVDRYGRNVTFKWIRREQNEAADALSRQPYQNPKIQAKLAKMKENSLKDLFGDDDIPW